MTQEVAKENVSGENKEGGDVFRAKKERASPPSKVVIRRLPPTMNLDTFKEQISPVPDNDYFYFVKADMSLGQNAFSRAYINFLHQEEMFIFKEKFDGYVFVDQKGNEYPAVVEFSPFQKIPKKKSKKKDSKSGTLESDPEYQKFLESLQKPEEVNLPSAETYLEEIESRQRELKASNGVPRLTTPLIEYIKLKKAEKLRIKEEKREERKRRDMEKKRQREEERKRRKAEREKDKSKDKFSKEKDEDKIKSEPLVKLLKNPEREKKERNKDSDHIDGAKGNPSYDTSDKMRSKISIKDKEWERKRRREEEKLRQKERQRRERERLKKDKEDSRPGFGRSSVGESRKLSETSVTSEADSDKVSLSERNHPDDSKKKSDTVEGKGKGDWCSSRYEKMESHRSSVSEEQRGKSYVKGRDIVLRKDELMSKGITSKSCDQETGNEVPLVTREKMSSEPSESMKDVKIDDDCKKPMSENQALKDCYEVDNSKDPRTERRIRNKDRPSIALYRPGIHRLSMQKESRRSPSSSSSPSPIPQHFVQTPQNAQENGDFRARDSSKSSESHGSAAEEK